MSRLGWFSMPSDAPSGQSDLILAGLVSNLLAQGLRVAGAVQINVPGRPDCACDMDLTVTGGDRQRFRISQSLGPGASGCRLDAGALEQAANLVSQRIGLGADLMILPKFGKQEAMGRGFCQAIAQAVEAEVPVLLHVAEEQISNFLLFAGEMSERVAPGDLADWCHGAARQAA